MGNTVYRLLMKLLANRIQPHIAKLISTNQSAFIKGRNIADNTILVREIIQSFESRSYKEKAFMLKSDISKAFDTLRWDFLEKTMKEVNMPLHIIQLMLNCMKSSQITVLVNGAGSGFLKLTRGLRQGCPMSPYLYILAMEFLTKSIEKELQQGKIKGIKLASTAPILTYLMYADDLMLMGQADLQEVQSYVEILGRFGAKSGLMVNPEKSILWFSGRCDEECKEAVLHALKAKMADAGEKYLGAIIDTHKGVNDRTNDLLLEKFSGRFAGWRMNLLSHAGRLALIKSTLQSIPVYYMTISLLPNKITNSLTALTRKFSWGKIGKDRYLSLISWHKICKPMEEGGLGIMDINLFNKALVMKTVWQVAANEERLWIKIMKAKYFPRGGFWAVKRTNDASALWRNIQRLKPELKNQVQWQIGDGTKIPALNQPWYGMWGTKHTLTNRERNMKVSDLYDQQQNSWKIQEIEVILGQQQQGVSHKR